MKRLMTPDENPADVIQKIDSFISNKDNTEAIVDNIGDIIKKLDDTEQVINNIEDEPYRKEMLGYVTMARTYVMNIIDSLDSMMEI